MPRQVHDGDRSRRAAELYLQGGMTAPAVAERFGMKLPTLWKAIRKLRAQGAESPPGTGHNTVTMETP